MLPFWLLLALAIAETLPCNPRLNHTCFSRNPALPGTFDHDFHTQPHQFYASSCAQNLELSQEGLSLSMFKRFDNPLITSTFYIFYGKVLADIRAAPGQGIVSLMYLQSDDLDEIDTEIFGGNHHNYQTNYFIKGNTSTYDRGGYHPINRSPMEGFSRYEMEWLPNKMTWTKDGVVIRELSRDHSQGIPLSPMFVKFSVWAGGDHDNAIGTIHWAGGQTDYSKLPATMVVKNVHVENYLNGTEYSYGYKNGRWRSVTAKNGMVLDAPAKSRRRFRSSRNLNSRRRIPLRNTTSLVQRVVTKVMEATSTQVKEMSSATYTIETRSFVQFTNGTASINGSSRIGYKLVAWLLAAMSLL